MKNKKNAAVSDEEIEYLWDGPIKYPPYRELSGEEIRILDEFHKIRGIDENGERNSDRRKMTDEEFKLVEKLCKTGHL